MGRKIALLFLAAAALSATGCAPKERWHSSTSLFFDTVCDVNLACSPADFQEAEKILNSIFSEVESLFAPGVMNTSSPLVLELFGKARQVYLDSGGAFDITVEPLSRLWGFRGGPHRIPSQQEIRNTLPLVGLDHVAAEEGRLIVPENMAFDWGGIGKGYGVDRAARELVARDIRNGFINAGGDLYCWGTNPQGELWKIGIKHPRREGFLGVLSISNLGAATSGDYQRYFEKDGVRYHHILDPKAGLPAWGKLSVTVIGPETTICDALSTALFVSLRPEDIINKYPDYGAIIVGEGEKVILLGRKFFLSWLH